MSCFDGSSNVVTFTVLAHSFTLALHAQTHILLCPLPRKYMSHPSYSFRSSNTTAEFRPRFHSHGLAARRTDAHSDETSSICGRENETNYHLWFCADAHRVNEKQANGTSQLLNCLRDDFDSPQWIRPWYLLIKSFRDLFIDQFTQRHRRCRLVTHLISSEGSYCVLTQDLVL